MPREAGAFYAGWVFAHSAESGELVQVLGGLVVVSACEQIVDLIEETQSVEHTGALHALGHQRRGRHGDRAAAALEADVSYRSVGEADVQSELVAAERIDCRDHASRVRDLAEVSRVTVVIEDHLPVELLNLIHGRSPR